MNEIENTTEIKQVGLCNVVWVKTDYIKRGTVAPEIVTKIETTAIRLGKDLCSRDGESSLITQEPLFQIKGIYYGPVQLKEPTQDDVKEQTFKDKKQQLLDKVKQLGLTDEEINFLRLI